MSNLTKACIKYRKKTYKQIQLLIRKDTYPHLIDWLESKENMHKYIIQLIEKDFKEKEVLPTCQKR